MKRVFVDANVLLEFLLNRRFAEQCTLQLKDVSREYAISVLTIQIVWYIAEKYNLDRHKVDTILAHWIVLSINTKTVKLARERYNDKDFEDCLQAVSAETGNCDSILTSGNNFATAVRV